jgi:hypothetical protein
MKKCCRCKTEKSEECFVKDKNRKDGLHPSCKECCKENKERFHKNNPYYTSKMYKKYKEQGKYSSDEWDRKRRNGKLKRLYNITIEDYDRLLERQENKCAICGCDSTSSRVHNRFSVDHDHKTGEIRGLLCRNCNMSLGGFDDSIELLSRAIYYLKDKNEEEF